MKTIFFDLDDTLYSRRQPFEKALAEMLDIRDEKTIRSVFDRVSMRGEEVFQDHEDGKITSQQMYIYRYCKGFADAGITISDQQALQFYDLYQYHLDHLTLDEDTVKMLDLCLGLFSDIGIITNGPSEHQRGKMAALGLEKWVNSDLIFISSELSSAKPDKKIFLRAAEKSGKSPCDLVMVGDSFEKDIVPPIELKWKTIYLIKSDFVKNHALCADFTVSSVRDLTDVLPRAAF